MTMKLDNLELNLATAINGMFDSLLKEFDQSHDDREFPLVSKKKKTHRSEKEKQDEEDPNNYHGSDVNISKLLAKASIDVGPRQNHLERLLVYLAKKEEEHEGNIEKLIGDNEKQRKEIEQLINDLNSKEQRFKDQEERFHAFNQQVASMGLTPQQQAQAAVQFAQDQMPELEKIKHQSKDIAKTVSNRPLGNQQKQNKSSSVASPVTSPVTSPLVPTTPVRPSIKTLPPLPRSNLKTIAARPQTKLPAPSAQKQLGYNTPEIDLNPEDPGKQMLIPHNKPTVPSKFDMNKDNVVDAEWKDVHMKKAGPLSSWLNLHEDARVDVIKNLIKTAPDDANVVHNMSPELAQRIRKFGDGPPVPDVAKFPEEILNANGKSLAVALARDEPMAQLNYGAGKTLTLYKNQMKKVRDVLDVFHEPMRTQTMHAILSDYDKMMDFMKKNVLSAKKLPPKNNPQQSLPLEEIGSLDYELLESFSKNLTDLWEDWNKVNHHDKTNGLSQKAVNAYRREHPGSKLKTAVTTKPSKLKPGSKAAKRRKSFCARMSGNKGPMKKPNGKPTPKALALRRWNCESIEEMQQLIQTGEQYIIEMKKGVAEGSGAQQAAIAIAKKASGKYTKDGQRKK